MLFTLRIYATTLLPGYDKLDRVGQAILQTYHLLQNYLLQAIPITLGIFEAARLFLEKPSHAFMIAWNREQHFEQKHAPSNQISNQKSDKKNEDNDETKTIQYITDQPYAFASENAKTLTDIAPDSEANVKKIELVVNLYSTALKLQFDQNPLTKPMDSTMPSHSSSNNMDSWSCFSCVPQPNSAVSSSSSSNSSNPFKDHQSDNQDQLQIRAITVSSRIQDLVATATPVVSDVKRVLFSNEMCEIGASANAYWQNKLNALLQNEKHVNANSPRNSNNLNTFAMDTLFKDSSLKDSVFKIRVRHNDHDTDTDLNVLHFRYFNEKEQPVLKEFAYHWFNMYETNIKYLVFIPSNIPPTSATSAAIASVVGQSSKSNQGITHAMSKMLANICCASQVAVSDQTTLQDEKNEYQIHHQNQIDKPIFYDPVNGQSPFRCCSCIKNLVQAHKVNYHLKTRRRIPRWNFSIDQLGPAAALAVFALFICVGLIITGNYATWTDSFLTIGIAICAAFLIMVVDVALLISFRIFSIIESQTMKLEDVQDSKKAVEEATTVFNNIYEPLKIFIARMSLLLHINMVMVIFIMFVTACSVFKTKIEPNEGRTGVIVQLFGIVIICGLMVYRLAKVNAKYESFLDRFFAFRIPNHSDVVAAYTYFSNNAIRRIGK
jgi:hypothetical protein